MAAGIHMEGKLTRWSGGRVGREFMRIIVTVDDVFNEAVPNLERVILDEVIRSEDKMLHKTNYDSFC